MGGHDGGSVASQLIVNSLARVHENTQLNKFVCDIEDTILQVNKSLLNYSIEKLNGRTIGSTFVTLLIKGNIGICLWAGDSRLYRFRHEQLVQMTEDHSHVAELVKQGLIAPEEADSHPEANVITRAVGTSDRLDIDIMTFDVNVGDQFLLCSDGLYNAVALDEIKQNLNYDTVEVSVGKLIQAALDNKASDNVSVVLVKGIHQNVA